VKGGTSWYGLSASFSRVECGISAVSPRHPSI